MVLSTAFNPLQLSFSNMRSYFFIAVFVAGNILLPQLTHLIPNGGLIFLPIYFFTLIASYKFGYKVGLLTAVCSPLLNHIWFGMPPAFVLPIILIKSVLIVIAAAMVSNHFKKVSIFHLLLVVLSYQVAGSFIEWGMTQRFSAAIQDITIGIPGMLLQVIGGWFILKQLAGYDNKTLG